MSAPDLAPHATANVDVKELIANQSRDEDGNTLPLNLQEGTFVFHNPKDVHGALSLSVNVGIFNVAKGTCYYGSVYCDGYWGSLIVDPSSFSVPSDGWVQVLYAYGQYTDGSTPGVGASWSSSNTSVASVDGGGNVTATKARQATITASASLPEEGEYSGYNPSCAELQPYVTFTGTATASIGDMQPTITGVQPSDWQAQKTTTVTITGQSFGTNAPTLSFSPNPGISYTLSRYSDTKIVANISVNASWGGVLNLLVTSNGYNGQGFQSNGNGQSAQSSGSNIGIYQVWNHAEITVIGWINTNAITLPGGANASLVGDLRNSVACSVVVGLWAVRSRYELQSSADVAYANAWLLKHSSNSQPPSTISPAAYQSGGDFRLFNDYGAPTGNGYSVGITPNPCGTYIPNWLRAGQGHPNNGATGCGTPSNQCYQLAEGRVGTVGQTVNQTLNGQSTPWIWSVIEFNPAGTPTYSDHAEFPSYSFYQNGVLTSNPYAPSAANMADFIGKNASYQRTPSQIQ